MGERENKIHSFLWQLIISYLMYKILIALITRLYLKCISVPSIVLAIEAQLVMNNNEEPHKMRVVRLRKETINCQVCTDSVPGRQYIHKGPSQQSWVEKSLQLGNDNVHGLEVE